jgi:putative ABC transport system permease protein
VAGAKKENAARNETVRILGSLRDFFHDIRTQRLRTFLTVMGITWGTVAVVVLLAFGVGMERQTRKRMHGLGERIVILFGNRTTKTYEGFPQHAPRPGSTRSEQRLPQHHRRLPRLR